MSEHITEDGQTFGLGCNLPEEVEYRSIPNFPAYRVGNDGSVWSRWMPGHRGVQMDRWKRMKPSLAGQGYYRVVLHNEQGKQHVYVHRLVLEAFVGPCPEGMEACHFPDRDKSNNRVSNLRWDTRVANCEDKVQHGTDNQGERNYNAKLTTEQVRELRERIIALRGDKPRLPNGACIALAAEYGVSKASISFIGHGVNWAHVA